MAMMTITAPAARAIPAAIVPGPTESSDLSERQQSTGNCEECEADLGDPHPGVPGEGEYGHASAFADRQWFSFSRWTLDHARVGVQNVSTGGRTFDRQAIMNRCAYVGLVQLVLPPSWYARLAACRHRYRKRNGCARESRRSWPGVARDRCPAFPSDNVWNTPVTDLPVDPRSGAWLAHMDAGSTFLHPDYGPRRRHEPVRHTVADHLAAPEVRAGPLSVREPERPWPVSVLGATPIEGGQNAAGDRHAIMVDPATCMLYELYDAHFLPGTLRPRARARSGTCDPTGFGPRAGPQLMRPVCRSCPASSTTTRSGRATSITQSDSPPRRPTPASCGRRDTRPARPATPTTHRWERGSA